MKKILCLWICSLLVLVSCVPKEPYKSFYEAYTKTLAVDRGQQSIQVDIKNTLNEETDIKEGVNRLKDMNQLYFEAITKYNYKDEQQLVESYNYVDMGFMGFDSEFYKNGDQNIIKIPQIEKYLLFNDPSIASQLEGESQITDEDLYHNLLKPILTLWVDMLQKENVILGEKTILQTEDGDVKATEYRIAPTKEQVRSFLRDALTVIEKNQFLLSIPGNNFTTLSQDKLIEIMNGFQQQIGNMDFSVNSISYVDMDGFIVDTNTEITILYPEGMLLQEQRINISMKNWDIYKKQTINIPNLSHENSMSLQELETYDLFQRGGN